MAEYIVNLDKNNNNITLKKVESNIELLKKEVQINLQHVGRQGERGIQGEPGSAISNLFIQDTEPTITEPSLWVQTESGLAKTLWLVTE